MNRSNVQRYHNRAFLELLTVLHAQIVKVDLNERRVLLRVLRQIFSKINVESVAFLMAICFQISQISQFFHFSLVVRYLLIEMKIENATCRIQKRPHVVNSNLFLYFFF